MEDRQRDQRFSLERPQVRSRSGSSGLQARAGEQQGHLRPRQETRADREAALQDRDGEGARQWRGEGQRAPCRSTRKNCRSSACHSDCATRRPNCGTLAFTKVSAIAVSALAAAIVMPNAAGFRRALVVEQHRREQVKTRRSRPSTTSRCATAAATRRATRKRHLDRAARKARMPRSSTGRRRTK
jgi:hypothetical protein